MNKTNRCTEFQLYWHDDSTCFGQPFCPSSGVLSRTSALVHYVQLWWPFATRSRMARSRSPQLHAMYQSRCTAQNSWWWAGRLPETCRVVIPIKLEFSASVGFIHFNLLRCTVMRTKKKGRLQLSFIKSLRKRRFKSQVFSNININHRQFRSNFVRSE